MAEDTTPKEGYCVREITRESGRDIVHLAPLPADARDRKDMEKTLKRLGELENTVVVTRFGELREKPEFNLTEMEKAELRYLEGTNDVKEFLRMSIDRDLLIGESATLEAPQGKYAVGDVISRDAAEKEPGFGKSRQKLASI